jgi:hypothetical protein
MGEPRSLFSDFHVQHFDEKGKQQTQMLTIPPASAARPVMGALFFANEIIVVRNRQTPTFDLSSRLIFGNDTE